MTEAPFPVPPARVRHPGRGYAMALTAALLWGFNGSVAKVTMVGALSSLQMVELRSLGAFAVLAAALLVLAPQQLRIRKDELPWLVAFGIAGLAFVQLLYLIAIRRLDVGVALLIEYTAPVLVGLYARFVLKEHVRNRVWAAIALALVVDVAHGVTLDGIGVAASLAAAVAYAIYVLLAERSVGDRSAVSLLCWGFLFASVFWAFVAPWWSFPFGRLDDDISLLGHLSNYSLPVWLLMISNVLVGTVVPFFLILRALRHLPATRVAIAAMAEPVVATVVAWAWLGEALGPAQLVGGAVVLAGIGLAQTAR